VARDVRELLLTYAVLQITGVSSFLGFAATVEALQSGYRVRAVVRKESQIAEIKSALPNQFVSQIEFVVIPNLGVAGVFDDHVKDVEYFVHVASPASVEVCGSYIPNVG
jgi:nucleoside-diphosphate-sugar epimerase